MGFLDIGWPELLLIIVIALIVFGPGKVVEFSKGFGKAIRSFKNATSNITQQVTREIGANPPSVQTKKKDDTTNTPAQS